MHKLRALLQRPEARHAGILVSGSMVAQIALLATTPILARLFSPDAFGVFALMLTISTIGGAIGGLCYEVAIIMPRSRRAARALYRLALILSLIIPALIVGLLALVLHFFPDILNYRLPASFFWCCLAATTLTAQINILGYAHSRAGRYRPIAVSKVTQTLFPAIAQIALALCGVPGEGLLIGRVIGCFGSEIWLWRKLPQGYRFRDLRQAGFLDMIAAGRTYKDFLLQVPRQVLVRSATMMPAALLLGAYGPTVAGYYFMAQRLIERPGALLGDSLNRVPMKQFAQRVQQRKPMTRAALAYTGTIAIPVILGVFILALIANPLFHHFFGARWEPAASYAVALACWAAVRMTSLPVATLTTVLRIQKKSFFIDAFFAARILIIPFLAAHDAKPLTAVAAFCGLSILYHLTVITIGLNAALRYDKTVPKLETHEKPEVSQIVPTGETYA